MPKFKLTVTAQSGQERIASRSILIPLRIWEELDSFDKNLKSKCIRAFRFLSRDMGHPSLRVETIKGDRDVFWRARVDDKYRFHFELREDFYFILAVGAHSLQGVG